MRELTSHKVNGLNESIQIKVTDEPGSGGANHRYELWLPDYVVDPPGCGHQHGPSCYIRFQNGPVGEEANGISNEAILAVLIDRLEGFSKGPFSCRENSIALTKAQECMHWLNHRTNERLAASKTPCKSKYP